MGKSTSNFHSLALFRKRALATTIRDDALIRSAPYSGLKTIPQGMKTPAAAGIAKRLYPVAQARFCFIFQGRDPENKSFKFGSEGYFVLHFPSLFPGQRPSFFLGEGNVLFHGEILQQEAEDDKHYYVGNKIPLLQSLLKSCGEVFKPVGKISHLV